MPIPAWLAGGIPRTACVAAYEPICAVSLADSYINRANPGTNDAAPGVAPTWAAETGWTFNGTTQYLTTGIDAKPAQFTIVARFAMSDVANYRTIVAGSDPPTGGVLFAIEITTKKPMLVYSSVAIIAIAGGSIATGENCVVALAHAYSTTKAYAFYINGLLNTSGVSAASYASGASAFNIGASVVPGSPTYFAKGNIQALYIYNVPITPTQVRAVTDAMNMLPMRPKVPTFPSWMRGAALTQFRRLLGMRTGSRGVAE